jgi:hypothetical protein
LGTARTSATEVCQVTGADKHYGKLDKNSRVLVMALPKQMLHTKDVIILFLNGLNTH